MCQQRRSGIVGVKTVLLYLKLEDLKGNSTGFTHQSMFPGVMCVKNSIKPLESPEGVV